MVYYFIVLYYYTIMNRIHTIKIRFYTIMTIDKNLLIFYQLIDNNNSLIKCSITQQELKQNLILQQLLQIPSRIYTVLRLKYRVKSEFNPIDTTKTYRIINYDLMYESIIAQSYDLSQIDCIKTVQIGNNAILVLENDYRLTALPLDYLELYDPNSALNILANIASRSGKIDTLEKIDDYINSGLLFEE